MNRNITLDSLQTQALDAGYALSTPLPDMYGGYECSLEHLSTGRVSVVMNFKSPIEAAQAVMSDIRIRASNAMQQVAELACH